MIVERFLTPTLTLSLIGAKTWENSIYHGKYKVGPKNRGVLQNSTLTGCYSNVFSKTPRYRQR